MKRKLQCQKGMTLVELLVTMAILSIVSVLLAGIFREGTLSSSHAIEDSGLNIEFRMKADGLRDDIRSSKSATIDGITYPSFNSDSKTLTLFTGTKETPTTLQYYLTDNILYRKPSGETAVSYAQDVTVFNVAMSGLAVDVTLEVNRISPDYSKRTYQKSITIKAKPRVHIS